MTERKGSLPYGWQVKTSTRYPDRVYYFNIFTGSSTWECPELDPPREIKAEEKSLAPASRNASINETKSLQSVKDIPKNLPKIQEENEKNCDTYIPPNINVSKNRPKISMEIKKKNNLFVPNSVTKAFKKHSDMPKKSSEEKGKSSAPPTAIVTPVILDRKPCDSQNETQTKSDDRLKREKPKKRSLDEVDSNSCDSPIQVQKKVKIPSKKTKISPLNRSDSEEEKSKLDVVSTENAENLSEESSTVDENNKDVEDIEMLDVSMDLIEDLTAKKDTVFDKFASYYIVVDTNVLISELDLINEIKDTPLDGCGPPHIFIPWIVIEELDRLKNNRGVKGLITKASCEAIRYLNSVLGKHPRFHGQSPAEAEKWAKTYSKVNDDKILECCTALSDKMPREKVILLTNDKNLKNKALICNIIVHDSTTLMKNVKPDVIFNYSKTRTKKSRKSHENVSEVVNGNVVSKAVEVPKESPPDKNLLLKRDTYKREIHSIMSRARQLLKDALTKFFSEEMEEAYGDIWLSFPIKKDLLEGILEGIKKYWTVFSTFMTPKDKRNFELLKEKVSRPAGFWGDKEDCLVILSTMEEIFTQVQKRRPSINVPVSVIQDFRVACVEFFQKYGEVENILQTAGQDSVLALFERNWAAINQLSGIVLDSCKIPHDFLYNKPAVMPSELEIRQLICNLYPAVEELKSLMFSMIEAVRNCKPLKKILNRLACALVKFIPNLEIPYEHVPFPNFSKEALELFCTRSQNREMIEIGYKQIQKFFSKLDDALTAIMSSKLRKRSASPETMICD